MADTLLSEKKYSRKKDKKDIDELSDTLFSEKKSLTKKAEKGNDVLSDTLLSEKKPLTNYSDKGTYELAFKKQKVNIIFRRGLNQQVILIYDLLWYSCYVELHVLWIWESIIEVKCFYISQYTIFCWGGYYTVE